MSEMKKKYEANWSSKGAIWTYIGNGKDAEEYAENVLEFARYCAEVES